MINSKLSVRINRNNKNHHLWNNNGKWWAHITVHNSDFTSERKRIPLRTRDVIEARRNRDKLMMNWGGDILRKGVAA